MHVYSVNSWFHGFGLTAHSSGGIIYPNDNGENLIEYIVLCKQSTIISY
jgi:hypothetical protein